MAQCIQLVYAIICSILIGVNSFLFFNLKISMNIVKSQMENRTRFQLKALFCSDTDCISKRAISVEIWNFVQNLRYMHQNITVILIRDIEVINEKTLQLSHSQHFSVIVTCFIKFLCGADLTLIKKAYYYPKTFFSYVKVVNEKKMNRIYV